MSAVCFFQDGGVSKGKAGILWTVFVVTCISGIFFLHSSASAETVELSGITEPLVDVTLSASVSGKVSRIFFREGDRVKAGDTILELSKTMEALEVERRKLVYESKVELNTSLEQEKSLKSLLDSTRALFEKTKSVSNDEMEKVALDYKLAVGKREQLEIGEEREKIELEMAVEDLNRRILAAPIKGTIIELFLDAGETCEPRQPLIHIVDTSRCRLLANVEEKLGRTLKKGNKIDLKIKTGDAMLAKTGEVVFVSPVVDSASNLLKVKIEFDNNDGAVRPGVAGTMLVALP